MRKSNQEWCVLHLMATPASPTNARNESDIPNFYKLSSLVWDIPKHNILIIGGNMNAQINFVYTNTKSKCLAGFTLENSLSYPNTKFPRREGKQWISICPNSTKAQLDYILINKKLINTAHNSEAYFSFSGVSSNYRIVLTWLNTEIRNKQSKPYVMTGPHLPTEI